MKRRAFLKTLLVGGAASAVVKPEQVLRVGKDSSPVPLEPPKELLRSEPEEQPKKYEEYYEIYSDSPSISCSATVSGSAPYLD